MVSLLGVHVGELECVFLARLSAVGWLARLGYGRIASGRLVELKSLEVVDQVTLSRNEQLQRKSSWLAEPSQATKSIKL